MKNLNKKIGVVVLSGLMVVGGGLASSASAYSSKYKVNSASEIKWKNGYYHINERDYLLDPLRKSKFESKWKGLRESKVSKGDLEDLIRYGKSPGYDYKILAVSSDNFNHKDIGVIPYSPYDREVVKLFNSIQDFRSHVWKIGMPAGVWAVNIAGVKYIIQFN